jgi:NADP-dependent 3-hydroxy acid dehydrogenase YdfG
MLNNTILITGASTGFGRDTAETLQRAALARLIRMTLQM